jgi:non-specific serine/threonine protein kinase
MIGQTLGHYKILEKLGEGGMGEVYLAKDTTLKRQVALKVLPAELAEDQERLNRFRREAETLAALDHPNIVHIHTVEREGGVRFLTMELVEGERLTDLIPNGGMSPERIFEIAIPLSDALASAHERGVIHRDLKPANIMVTAEGRAKVLDFGLAKLRSGEGRVPMSSAMPTEPLTEEGRIVGTMPYMSPEQLEGDSLDARSDIFSLGVVLYEMATGERPFKGESSVSLISSIMKDTPREVDSLRAEVPHHLARIIRHCLEKDPKRRYQSALDVRNKLEDLHREETSQVEVPTPTVSGLKASTENKWWPVAAASVAVVLVVLLALWLRKSDTPSKMAAESPAEPAASVETQPPMIVVLPFENLGAPEDEYFADGMTEEITSRLAVVSGLRVISRTSAMQYKENRPSLKRIEEELGVDYVLEGSVRWARSGESSRVRITPQLIRVADDSHLWGDSYDRVIEDIFEIQSAIASTVVDQLGATLKGSEREEVEARPTDSLEAYEAYLRGGRAVELDTAFLEAWVALSGSHSMMYWIYPTLVDTKLSLSAVTADSTPETPSACWGGRTDASHTAGSPRNGEAFLAAQAWGKLGDSRSRALSLRDHRQADRGRHG